MDNCNITNIHQKLLERFLNKMLVIRETEEFLAKKIEERSIHCPCHLAVGQEAPAVAFSECLTKDDRVFGTHRSHAHYLAMNDDIEGLLAEVLGKETGCSRGMGGSMHLIDEKNGFGGSVPIVGATIPIAAGAALAMKLQKTQHIAIAYFGDGATEEGGFHETLNLASSMQLPVCFVCENNLFASHLHILERQPKDHIIRFAEAHAIKHARLNGNDVTELYREFQKISQFLREERKPFFIEVLTYRWKGHVGYREDIDVGLKRSCDLKEWKKRDPIKKLANAMMANGLLTDAHFSEMKIRINERLLKAWDDAIKAPYPHTDHLLGWVYSKTRDSL
jgi:pyruvate dehydrogenase E1 component alpha subunit